MTATLDRPTAAVPDEDDEVEVRRRPRLLDHADRAELAVALGGAVVVAAGVRLLLDWTHPLTLGCITGLCWILFGWGLCRDRLGADAARDRVMRMFIWSTAAIATALLTWMIVYVLGKGLKGLTAHFFTEDMAKVGPLNPGGGALHAIVGTIEQVAIASVVAIPVGVMTAVYLHEVRGRLAGVIRLFTNAMSGLPSMVAGLLIYVAWVTDLHEGFSGFAGALALVVVMLPVVIRTAEEMLRTVPDGLRESALALGYPNWRVVLRIVLPTARVGLVTASILAIARVVGETPPLLYTAFHTEATNWNPFSGAQTALPTFVYNLIGQPNAVHLQRAWTGLCLLVLLVMALFIVARVLSGRGRGRLSGGGR
jgi:phosphate transport system permease protein